MAHSFFLDLNQAFERLMAARSAVREGQRERSNYREALMRDLDTATDGYIEALEMQLIMLSVACGDRTIIEPRRRRTAHR